MSKRSPKAQRPEPAVTGFDWQMELAGGGDAVGWEIQVTNDLLLIREAGKE
jgi:hypothetical protein